MMRGVWARLKGVWRWLRAQRGRANAICRDARTIGAALVVAAGLAFSFLAVRLAEGHHLSSTWLYAGGYGGGLGLLLGGGGWLGGRLTHRDSVSLGHAETLWASAKWLRDCVVLEGACDYGSGHRPRDAFHAHFPDLSAVLDEWDSLFASDIACRDALKKRAENESRDVAFATEGRWSLDSAHIAAHITDSTLGRAHGNELAAAFSLEGHALDLATPTRDDGESADDWGARIERNISRVEALGRASQDWPETAAAAESHRRVEAFKRERKAEVVQRLQLILEHGRPLVAKECPTCKGIPS